MILVKNSVLVTIALVLCAGCIGQASPTAAAVKTGDIVSVYYTLEVDGSVIDSNAGKSLLTFMVGAGEMIPGFEKGVLGMKLNEERTFSVSPDQGYGMTGSHPLAGKTLVFTVKVADIKK